MVEKVSRIRSEDLQIGVAVEKKKHPWISTPMAKKIARDNLHNNRNAYTSGSQSESTTVVLNQNVKAIAPKKRKKKSPVPIDNRPSWIRW